jgi:hypothetical protein
VVRTLSVVPAVWRVTALATPRVLRRCPRCDAERPFASSDRFRVNAQKKRLDVWLIYRCETCEDTWNLTVHTRVTPDDIGLTPYQDNDITLAWRCAFDARLLARAGACASWPVPFTVEASALSGLVTIDMPHPVGVRLDRLAAVALGVSRTAAVSRLEAPDGALRRAAFSGQQFLMR